MHQVDRKQPTQSISENRREENLKNRLVVNASRDARGDHRSIECDEHTRDLVLPVFAALDGDGAGQEEHTGDHAGADAGEVDVTHEDRKEKDEELVQAL